MRVNLGAGDGAEAEIRLHGAHVTSWVTPDGAERLFLSADSVFAPDAAIRGGVPVIFPQFANVGPLPKHGFVRTKEWRLINARGDAEAPSATFRLTDSPATRAIWPRSFVAELTVSLPPGALELALTVTNSDIDSFEFTAALHTYLRVDAPRTVVRGLRGVRYRDSTAGGVVRTEDQDDVRIQGEINRIYLDVPGALDVVEPQRTMRVTMTGFRDVVVWNPGAEGEAVLGDMERGGSAHMVCVEAAAIGAPVTLAPGGEWRGTQRLTAS